MIPIEYGLNGTYRHTHTYKQTDNETQTYNKDFNADDCDSRFCLLGCIVSIIPGW